MSGGGAPLDPEALDRLHKLGGDALVGQLVEMFVSGAAGRAAEARAALERGDLEVVERTYHSLKSSAANLGASEVRALCGELEALARRRDEAGVREVAPELDGALERACAALAARRPAG